MSLWLVEKNQRVMVIGKVAKLLRQVVALTTEGNLPLSSSAGADLQIRTSTVIVPGLSRRKFRREGWIKARWLGFLAVN